MPDRIWEEGLTGYKYLTVSIYKHDAKITHIKDRNITWSIKMIVLGCTVVSSKTSLKKTVFGSQAFTIMDQNRDGFIDKNDLRDTFAALGTLTSMLAYLGNRHLSGLIRTVCVVYVCGHRASECETGRDRRNAQRSFWSDQLHSLPYHVWRETER